MSRKSEDHERTVKKIAEAMPHFGYLRSELLCKLRDDERELFRLALLKIGRTEQVQEKRGPYLSIKEAADLIGFSRKRLYNIVSAAKRKGREFDWVLRQGRKRGFVIDRKRFVSWIEKRAKQKGRPRKYGV